MSQFVFVYGTLRRGEINDIAQAAARAGLPEPRLAGMATVPGVLYDFGDWPGLAPEAGAAPVVGEVYEIDDALLRVLDGIEEYEPGRECLFVRRQVAVMLQPAAAQGATAGAPPENGTGPASGPVRCWYYPIDLRLAGGARRTEARDWVAYRLSR